MNNIGIIILAAGKGKRMQSDLPKVLHELNNKPLIEYVVSLVEKLNIKPAVVVSEDGLVKKYLGDRVDYVIQAERLGTGHAVMQAENLLKNKVEKVVVLYGDMPFLKPESVVNLVGINEKENNKITLMITRVPNFESDYKEFYDFGRIVRSSPSVKTQGKIQKIVEKKDASGEELEIKELNTGYFCFESDWLWNNLKKLKNNNQAEEYYLTDLVGQAIASGDRVGSVEILPEEAIGINTREHLEKLN
ncbi:MAG: NTP transferase domain-containing protein [Candidatus Magasanikiibacteriota bacterium]